jgi:hypothetical protein
LEGWLKQNPAFQASNFITEFDIHRSRHELTHITDNENGVQSLLWLFGKPRFALQFNFEGVTQLNYVKEKSPQRRRERRENL